ncbi:tryptophan--tRNA ligase [Candidatus Caldatribacterium sp.]|uniref:tryptophan--tRNA ligase n=1 Tax=Candidatus Caldatribacterium sp. TaxID=2282143 RepID=UPI003849B7F4|nr:tryptophan--tRNA ligase [Candidatus Caldatribacterium sp.]
MEKERIFSGMRPTGRMHIGHYFGVLRNWVRLQHEYFCIFGVADWHALTTSFEDTVGLERNIIDMVTDWLSVGVDPEKCLLIVQSLVPEHAELHLLFSMITPVGWLERNPVLKQQLQDMGLKEVVGYGHLGYPVLMAADILIYKATKVPVGEDQVPHIEITREIARRFNALYGPVFPEPQALLTESPRILGIDGRKMSKSLRNQIDLSSSPEEIREKVMVMFTDPEKIRKSDPGHPERCNVFAFHQAVGNKRREEIEEDCRKGLLGCVACKKELAEQLMAFLQSITPHRDQYEGKPDFVKEILIEGSRKARLLARETIEETRRVMHIHYGVARG